MTNVTKAQSIKESVINLVANKVKQEVCLNKSEFLSCLNQLLTDAGYKVERELAQAFKAMGYKARFNYILTDKKGNTCVIELDNRSPRQKSLMKINELPSGVEGFILLRNGKTLGRYQTCGVDVVCAIKG